MDKKGYRIDINPNKKSITNFIENIDMDKPVVMLNLLKYFDKAQYPISYTGDKNISGKAAYDLYKRVLTNSNKEGIKLLLSLDAKSPIIGDITKDSQDDWDEVMIVEYANPMIFINMLKGEEYRKSLVHREAGLKATKLILTY